MKWMKNTFFLLVLTSLGLGASAALQFDPTQILTVGFRPSHIDCGDIDGDGYPDLVVTNMFSHSLTIAYNNGEGSFNRLVEVPYINSRKHPTSVAVGDLDGDQDMDIATSHIQDILNMSSPFQNVGLVLFYNLGEGQFEQVYIPFDGNPSMMLIRDLNGDGQNDLLVGDNGELSFETSFIGQFEPGITLYLNKGNRQFDLFQNILTDGSIVYLNYEDFNNDGQADLLGINQGQIIINELFQTEIIDPSLNYYKRGTANYPEWPTTLFPVQYDPYTSDTADFDYDGRLDFVVSLVGKSDLLRMTGENASVDIYRNNGESFQKYKSIATPGISYQVLAQDYDNDGDMDFAVTVEKVIGTLSGDEYEPYLKLYENDGENNFTELSGPINPNTGRPQELYPVDYLPRYGVTADFDQDGDMDIAVLCSILDAADGGGSITGRVHVFHNRTITTVGDWTLF
ncbi:MAG: VCBS repeat-containing protein [bacterium]|jgi:hypothetical protein|nr:VCBS repeat-containing protein [bacterium]